MQFVKSPRLRARAGVKSRPADFPRGTVDRGRLAFCLQPDSEADTGGGARGDENQQRPRASAHPPGTALRRRFWGWRGRDSAAQVLLMLPDGSEPGCLDDLRLAVGKAALSRAFRCGGPPVHRDACLRFQPPGSLSDPAAALNNRPLPQTRRSMLVLLRFLLCAEFSRPGRTGGRPGGF